MVTQSGDSVYPRMVVFAGPGTVRYTLLDLGAGWPYSNPLGGVRDMPSTEPLGLVLLAVSGPNMGGAYPLQRLIIGRGHEAEIRVDADGVSRQHARIEIRQGQAWIADLGSKNGTRVNGVPVSECPLRLGDRLTVGPLTLVLWDPRGRSAPKLVSNEFGYDLSVLAHRLVVWAEEWGACAADLRFWRLGRCHACVVANHTGRTLVDRLAWGGESGLGSRLPVLLTGLGQANVLEERLAFGWLGGRESGDPVPSGAPLAFAESATPVADWQAATQNLAGVEVPNASFQQVSQLLSGALPHDCSLLYVSVPERAVRTAGPMGDLVVFQALFEESTSQIHERLGGFESRASFQARARDAATHLVVWSSLGLQDVQARSQHLWEELVRASMTLFEGHAAPHDPAAWTEATLQEQDETLGHLSNLFLGCLAELGSGADLWLSLAGARSSRLAVLWAAKAAAHHAVHPLLLACLLEDRACATEAVRLPQAVRLPPASPHAEIELLVAIEALRRAEGSRIDTARWAALDHDLGLVFDLQVTHSAQQLTNALLFESVPLSEPGRRTTWALSRLRPLCRGVGVELCPEAADRVTVTLRFFQERYV